MVAAASAALYAKRLEGASIKFSNVNDGIKLVGNGFAAGRGVEAAGLAGWLKSSGAAAITTLADVTAGAGSCGDTL